VRAVVAYVLETCCWVWVHLLLTSLQIDLLSEFYVAFIHYIALIIMDNKIYLSISKILSWIIWIIRYISQYLKDIYISFISQYPKDIFLLFLNI